MALLGGLYWGKKSARWLSGLLVIGSFAFINATAVADTLSFAYDAAGRLQQAQSTSQVIEYHYDAAGNLTSQSTPAVTALSLSGFTPNSGVVGTSVQIQGTGFSATPASNTVTINGVGATVTAATANALTIQIPASATTGSIKVTAGGQTVTSTDAFNITATALSAAPIINSVSTQITDSATTVTVNGSNFLGSGADLWVRVNGQFATVTSVSATQISFTLPAGATSGSVTIGDRNGESTASGTLYVAPSSVAATSVAITSALTVNSAAQNITIPAGKIGLLTFSNASQTELGLSVTGLTAGPLPITILNPDGSTLGTCSISTPGGSCPLAGLRNLGSYSLVVTPPSGSAATFSVALSGDVTGQLVANGAFVTFDNTGHAGQNGRYQFNGIAGADYTLSWVGSTLPSGSSLVIYSPEGSQLSSNAISNTSGTIDLTALPYTGSYTVRVLPGSSNTSGQISLGLSATGVLTIDGPTLTTTINAGLNGYYSFTAKAGQQLGLGISALTTNPASGYVTVLLLNLDGTVLSACGSYYASNGGGSCDLSTLPDAGTYAIKVIPGSNAAANFTLTLSSALTGNLTAGGATTTFSTARIGQDGRYTFYGVDDQSLSLVLSGGTFPSGGTLSIYNPDRTQLGNSVSFGVASTNSINLSNLPMTGNYTVVVDPNGTGVGKVDLKLNSDASNNLVVNGGALTTYLASGQNGDYTFNGTTGQRLGLGVTALTTSPSGGYVNVQIILPDNVTVLTSCGNYSSNGGCDIQPTLPMDGVYTVRVTSYNYAATFTLTLSTDLTGTLVSGNSATTFTNSRTGQNGLYTFNGVAGHNMSLALSNTSFTSLLYAYVYKPDQKTQLGNTYIFPGSSSTSILPLNNLDTTGTYSVLINTQGALGSVNLQINDLGSTTPGSETVNGSIPVDGAPANLNISPSVTQNYTFSGTTGQHLGLGVSALTTNPAGGYISILVVRPDNSTTLVNCGNFLSSITSNCPLSLPQDGTYTVRVINQSSSATASVTLMLSSDLAGTLTAGGAVRSYSTARVGQNARFTFNGVGGQNLNLYLTGITFANSGKITVYMPDSTQMNLNATTFYKTSVNSYALTNLPATGTYSVFINPYAADLGSMNVQLFSDAANNIVVDGNALTTSLQAGQNGDYTFNGKTGQHIGLGITGITTTPAGGNVSISVIEPDHTTTLINCGVSITCNLPVLPEDGLYTVRVLSPGYASNFSLWLSSELSTAVNVNGANATAGITRVGQGVRVYFNALEGGRYYVNWSGAGFNSRIYFFDPIGTQLDSTLVSASGPEPITAHYDGQYSVLVYPNDGTTGNITLNITGNKIDKTTLVSNNTNDGDVPLPPWALVIMTAVLWVVIRQRQDLIS